jgi:hypothetical protein
MPGSDVINLPNKEARQRERSAAEAQLLMRLEQIVDGFAIEQKVSKEDAAKLVLLHFDKYRMKNSAPHPAQ